MGGYVDDLFKGAGHGQCLLTGDQEDDPGSEEAGGVAAPVRQVPDEHNGVSFA